MLLLFVNGCQPSKPNDRYDLQECKEELLGHNDYIQNDNSIDHIVVVKKRKMMYLYRKTVLQGSIPISLGKNSVGHKVQEGDYRTPEGTYRIYKKICSPKYYRSLCISYPNVKDRAVAKDLGVSPGGDITLHAQPKWNANGKENQHTLSKNWTRGCMAMTNNAMDNLWYRVPTGTPITIIP